MNIRNANIENDADLMRELVRSAIWDVKYHEQALGKAHKVVAGAKALLARSGFNFTLQEAIEAYEEDEMQEDDPDDTTSWAKCMIGGAADRPAHHEEELQKAHKMIAVTRILLARCNYPDINLDEITA
jgi:hypothetical protein